MRHKKVLKEKAAAAAATDSATAPSGEAEPGTDAFDPNSPPKPIDQMGMPEQLQWNQKVMRHKKILKERAAEE